jgi:predicted CXXCH cytochrome family protein
MTGADDGAGATRSGFFNTARIGSLHGYHSAALGLTCSSCHASHGTRTARYLLRTDVMGLTLTPTGGSCTTDCHRIPAAATTYAR